MDLKFASKAGSALALATILCASGAAMAQWVEEENPGTNGGQPVEAAASPIVHSGTQYLVKNNAALVGCFDATMTACRQVFGACQRAGSVITYVGEGESLSAICGEITVLTGGGVVMSLGYGAAEGNFMSMRDRVAEMTRITQETYW